MWHVCGEVHKDLVGIPEGKNHLEHLGIDGRIILKRF
jgi:hypothetical protein